MISSYSVTSFESAVLVDSAFTMNTMEVPTSSNQDHPSKHDIQDDDDDDDLSNLLGMYIISYLSVFA